MRLVKHYDIGRKNNKFTVRISGPNMEIKHYKDVSPASVERLIRAFNRCSDISFDLWVWNEQDE